ncbi:MAG: hypothetical protein ACH34U_14165, partial [Cyanobium sp.]
MAQLQTAPRRRLRRAPPHTKIDRWAGLGLLTLQEQVPAGPVPRIRPHLRSRLSRPRMEPEKRRYPRMREIVFRVLAERPGHLEAQA